VPAGDRSRGALCPRGDPQIDRFVVAPDVVCGTGRYGLRAIRRHWAGGYDRRIRHWAGGYDRPCSSP